MHADPHPPIYALRSAWSTGRDVEYISSAESLGEGQFCAEVEGMEREREDKKKYLKHSLVVKA